MRMDESRVTCPVCRQVRIVHGKLAEATYPVVDGEPTRCCINCRPTRPGMVTRRNGGPEPSHDRVCPDCGARRTHKGYTPGLPKGASREKVDGAFVVRCRPCARAFFHAQRAGNKPGKNRQMVTGGRRDDSVPGAVKHYQAGDGSRLG